MQCVEWRLDCSRRIARGLRALEHVIKCRVKCDGTCIGGLKEVVGVILLIRKEAGIGMTALMVIYVI